IHEGSDLDLREARLAKSKHIGRHPRDVDNPATDERPAVVDDKHHRPLIGGHPDMGPEEQETMRAGHPSSRTIKGCLAGPALGLRRYASGQQRDASNDNISQYLYSMR